MPVRVDFKDVALSRQALKWNVRDVLIATLNRLEVRYHPAWSVTLLLFLG